MMRLVVTSGEPAGIGPDLCVALAGRDWPFELVVAGDPGLLRERAGILGQDIVLRPYAPGQAPGPQRAGELTVLARPLARPVLAGRLDAVNARYVLSMLDAAVDGCVAGEFAGMVTAPVQKSVINDAGIVFSGHTEYLAHRLGVARPVMLLAAGDALRVALVTTHLPLAAVPAAITREAVLGTLTVLDRDLRARFRIAAPRILVCGLNPHAGESGHLGREEIEVIAPALAEARAAGIDAIGPLPADTLFTPRVLEGSAAVLAMYHDQGLPVLKHVGFGHAVNVALGLPVVRTSVDHGTALDLAGTGRADPGSLFAAVELAARLAGG
ncbi:MAG: 4-hydroxythreonine-4-phosphate dehydrogenase PdxA [Steroidobacteraceae bacterium]|jgi:4-hydroxythreonine-4-phosphate dehydrogenase|nr:4-hydroxythreonine-4-phosphate dehydrogenase PdxA [Steroidobacteraceae bacterium]